MWYSVLGIFLLAFDLVLSIPLLPNVDANSDAYTSLKLDPSCVALKLCEQDAMLRDLEAIGYTKRVAERLATRAVLQRRRCSCSETCQYFGTCCTDLSSKETQVLISKDLPTACLTSDNGIARYVISTCQRVKPVNSSLIKACEEPSGKPLPMVTSARTQITYKNMNCALCSLETPDVLATWTWDKANCSEISRQKTDKLDKRSCDARQKPPVGGQIFGGFTLSPSFLHDDRFLYAPDNLTNWCDAKLIRECPKDADKAMAERCRTAGASFVQDSMSLSVYFNEYCAICNKVSVPSGCNTEENRNGEGELPTTSVETMTYWPDFSTEPASRNASKDEFSSTFYTESTTQSITTAFPENEIVSSLPDSSTLNLQQITAVTNNSNSVSLQSGWYPSGTKLNLDPNTPVLSQGEPVADQNRDNWIPSGTRIILDNDRGSFLQPLNVSDSNTLSQGEPVVDQNRDNWLPSGTSIILDNDRGSYLPPSNLSQLALPSSNNVTSLFPHGTSLQLGGENLASSTRSENNTQLLNDTKSISSVNQPQSFSHGVTLVLNMTNSPDVKEVHTSFNVSETQRPLMLVATLTSAPNSYPSDSTTQRALTVPDHMWRPNEINRRKQIEENGK